MEQNKNNMALASMILGILSIVLSCCCCLGMIMGGLAVLFACLSRVEQKFEQQAMIGLITGIIGIVLGVVGFFVLLILDVGGLM